MRIIAGKLGGQNFDSPPGNRTHPMSDKARGAIFNALGDVDGLTVLDAFTGSGGLAFEAVSRGSGDATAVDIDKSAVTSVVNSAQALGISKTVKAIRANVSSWSDNNEAALFDIVLCDPPYDQLQFKLLQKLVRHLRTGGIYVLSWPGKLEIPEFMGLKLIKQNSHGDAQLAFYRRIP